MSNCIIFSRCAPDKLHFQQEFQGGITVKLLLVSQVFQIETRGASKGYCIYLGSESQTRGMEIIFVLNAI